MELNYAFLANSAEVTSDGRFFVLGGGIDGFATNGLPTILPAMSIIVSIRFYAEECDKNYEFSSKIIAPSGTELGGKAATVLSPKIPVETPGIGPNMKVAFAFLGLLLPEMGRYTCLFAVDDRQIGEAFFYLNPVETEKDGRE
jgi:hypothetical protein